MKFAYASGSRPLPDFTIKRGIGVGGFGEVYFATSEAGKEVALKRIQRNLEVEVRGVTQCLNLRHRNLIDLYDIKYDDAGQAWVVMEYVSGESLREVLDRRPNGLPAEEANRWFEQIASGVSYLHDNGIVHRDLKPGNIFADDDAIKIGDYGLSKFISCSRRSGQTESVGTFHYMAPEIGKGVYGKEIDIYALGVILYELTTGKVPFDGESSQEIIMKHLTADPDLSIVPAAYREVIRRALLKDPDQRFRSANEMLESLHRGSVGPADPPPRLREPELEIAEAVPVVIKSDEPMYIGDEEHGIDMGPLKEHAPAREAKLHGQRTRPGVVRAQQPVYIREPIAAAAVRGGRSAAAYWRDRLSTPLKVLVVVGAVCVLLAGAPWLIALSIILGGAYLLYLAVWSIATSIQTRRVNTATNEKQLLESRRSRPSSERLSEWLGSLLLSAVVCGIFAALMMLAADRPVNDSVSNMSFFAWLSMTATAAAWTLLSVGRWWERSDIRKGWRPRGIALLAGVLVGVASFGLQSVMLGDVAEPFVNVDNSVSLGAFDSAHVPAWLYAGGRPQLLGFVLFFGGLFGILGWSKRVDPLRSSRFSFWATAIGILCGWILLFPQPWGLMLAAAVSVAVQLSSPWVSHPMRARPA